MVRPSFAWSAVLLSALLFSSCREVGIDIDDFSDSFDPNFTNEKELINGLAVAYQTRDIKLFALLFANNAESNAQYLFFLGEPGPNNETQWGFMEELRLHRRMFDPEGMGPGVPGVPPEVWLVSISIALTQATDFVERSDLYVSETNPNGLDPEKWRASAARYSTFVLFAMAGEIDFLVEDHANFVVIDDLSKELGTRGKFLILTWEELLLGNISVETEKWSAVKYLYK